MRKWVFMIVFLALVVGILYYISFGSYSEGKRAGFVLRLSKKGYIFKTYEGELRLGGLHEGEGVMNASEWMFSVSAGNKEAIKKLEEAIATGQRASLTYEEKFFVLPWNGETKFFVTSVEVLPVGHSQFPLSPSEPEHKSVEEFLKDSTSTDL